MKRMLCLIVGLLFVSCVQANLLTNADFELGDLGQMGSVSIDGWTTWGTNGWHHDDTVYKYDGKGVKLWWDATGIYQDFDAVAGETYSFSLEAISSSADMLKGWDLEFRVEWYNESGIIIGSSTEIGRFYGSKSDVELGDGVESWKTISAALQAPDLTTTGRIIMDLTHAGDWGWTGGSVFFDNASVIPEPATLVLLGLGSIVLLRRK